jgi:hypothetical protein
MEGWLWKARYSALWVFTEVSENTLLPSSRTKNKPSKQPVRSKCCASSHYNIAGMFLFVRLRIWWSSLYSETPGPDITLKYIHGLAFFIITESSFYATHFISTLNWRLDLEMGSEILMEDKVVIFISWTLHEWSITNRRVSVDMPSWKQLGHGATCCYFRMRGWDLSQR